jgi:hypothetical protein
MTSLQRSPQTLSTAATGRSESRVHQPFDEGLDVLKERQLVFNLVRKLAQAQFVQADRQRSNALWQEVAALNFDPDRVIRLLYGCDDYDNVEAMEAIDRLWRQEARQRLGKIWRRPAWLGGRKAAKRRGASRTGRSSC